MPRRLAIVLEQLWMEGMRQFFSFHSVDLLLRLLLEFGLYRICSCIVENLDTSTEQGNEGTLFLYELLALPTAFP